MEGNDHSQSHHHEHSENMIKKIWSKIFHTHSHDHGMDIDPQKSTEEGIRALKISFLGLMFTAILQFFVVLYTDSVALLADTIHNFSDAFTSLPLWLAFVLGKRERNSRYTYGYGKAEDLAGLIIIVMIGASAVLVFLESVQRLLNPQPVKHLLVLALAAIIGFIGNEIVARYRIRVGRKINSEALVADGLHSRTDGYVSLSVLIGVIATYLGFPIVDPIIGIIIGILILFIFADVAKRIWMRLMDSIDPILIEEMRQEMHKIEEITEVGNIKARWVGRRILAEVEITIDRDMTVAQSYEVEMKIQSRLKNKIPVISELVISDVPCDHHLSN